MPELSRFEGIIIKMLFNDTVQHNKPHVHVMYGDGWHFTKKRLMQHGTKQSEVNILTKSNHYNNIINDSVRRYDLCI